MRLVALAGAATYLGVVVVLSPARGLLDLVGKHGLDLDGLVADTEAHLADWAQSAGISLDSAHDDQ